jgi:hypothetical protein
MEAATSALPSALRDTIHHRYGERRATLESLWITLRFARSTVSEDFAAPFQPTIRKAR